jgi:radical SAM superfamily enzyme YgiQ (UPF0313 family)
VIERVIFFQPRTFAERNYVNSFGEEQTWTPWFAILLAPIAERAGLPVKLVDARINPAWMDEIGTLSGGDLLAVSVMTGNAIRDAVAASERARELGARVVWGGPHVSLFPNETLREAPVDWVVGGFGYAGFEELLGSLGLDASPVEHSETVPLDVSLDLVPNWARYLNPDIAIADRTTSLITSEGCSRRCTYCSEPKTSDGRWLTFDVGMTIDIAEGIRERSGANGFKLHDPNFFHDLDRAMTFASGFYRRLGLPWAATMHPSDLARTTEKDLGTLGAAGLARVLVGLESPDRQIVKLAGKQYDPALIPELARKLADAKIRGMFSFIVGWPNAEPGHYERTISCARALRDIWSEHQAKIHFLEPWPGTPIFKLLTRQGFEAPRSLTEWAEIDYYQARYASIHDVKQVEAVRKANMELSPYVDA